MARRPSTVIVVVAQLGAQEWLMRLPKFPRKMGSM